MAHIKWHKSLTRQTMIRAGYEILKYRTEGKIGYWTLVTDNICTASLNWEYCVLLWRRLTFLGFKDAHTHIHACTRTHTHVHAVTHSNTRPHTLTEAQSRSYAVVARSRSHTHTHTHSHAHTHRGSVSSHVHELEVNKALRTEVAPTNNSIQGVSWFVDFMISLVFVIQKKNFLSTCILFLEMFKTNKIKVFRNMPSCYLALTYESIGRHVEKYCDRGFHRHRNLHHTQGCW
jgi:hypothetical protein